MGRSDSPRNGSAQPKAHGSASRESGEGRLDPVRWRRPGRGTLIRLSAVAALLVTAAVVSWSPTPPCGIGSVASDGPAGGSTTDDGVTPTSAAAEPPHASRPAAALSPGTGVPSPGTGAAIPAGRVGVPIRLADPTALALVRPGHRVDLLRLDDVGGNSDDSTQVAADAPVLAVTGADDLGAGGLLLALSPGEATRAVTGTEHGFAVLIRPG